jgi:general stress protein 26
LEEVLSWFGLQQVVYLATVDGLQPRVRPMTLIDMDGGFYMITGARGGVNAAKLAQIRRNPRVEYYMTLEGDDGDGFIRAEATAEEVNDMATKKLFYERVRWAESYFESPDHPDYVLLGITHRGFSYRRPGEYDIRRVAVD